MGNPYRIETSCHYASIRQIHAAIEHWQRGDFECAMTLAGAAEGMLPDIDERPFQELQHFTRINEISNWLMHGERERGRKATISTRSLSANSTLLSRSIERS